MPAGGRPHEGRGTFGQGAPTVKAPLELVALLSCPLQPHGLCCGVLRGSDRLSGRARCCRQSHFSVPGQGTDLYIYSRRRYARTQIIPHSPSMSGRQRCAATCAHVGISSLTPDWQGVWAELERSGVQKLRKRGSMGKLHIYEHDL
jgi:hypothetical protein